jgi:hypothetical protein
VYAVRGTEVAEDLAPINTKAHREAKQYYKFLLYAAGDWLEDATPYEEWLDTAGPPPVPRPAGLPLHPTHPHDVTNLWSKFKCAECHRWVSCASKQVTIRAFHRARCSGATPAALGLREKFVAQRAWTPIPPKAIVAKSKI